MRISKYISIMVFLCAISSMVMAAGTNEGNLLQSFRLTSSVSGTTPFTVGLAFKQGDTLAPTLDIPEYQCVTKRTWNDGSVKHAICSGLVAMEAGVPKAISAYSSGTQPVGTVLSNTDIVAATPTASVQLGALGTVTLSSLLGSPVRTWISGPAMVEAHYQAVVDTTLVVKFHVRLYADDSVWVRAIVENGLVSEAGAHESYAPTVTIGENIAYAFADKSISNVTQEQQSVGSRYYRQTITAAGHGFVAGQHVYLSAIGGMTELNGQYLYIDSVTADTFTTLYRNTGALTPYTSGGTASFAHLEFTRWDVEGWVAGTNPGITVAQDTAYLKATKLVPNYWKNGPSDAALNGTWRYNSYSPYLESTYTPTVHGSWNRSQGATGFQTQIGLLPWWDALYINSGGDPRAWNILISAARAANSFPVVQGDNRTPTYAPLIISDPALDQVDDPRTQISAGSITWDIAHHGSAGYLPYLVTGDYYYLETLEYTAVLTWIFTNQSNGLGTNRVLKPVQTRGVAWTIRTVGQLAAIGPDNDDIVDDFRALMRTNADYWNTAINSAGMNQLGAVYVYEFYGDGEISPWQWNFWVQTYGMLRDLEPLADMTTLVSDSQWFDRFTVGLLGGNSADQYCFTKASTYTIKVSDASNSPTEWYDSWGTVHEKTWGAPNTTCANTLEGISGGAPENASTGYWGNLLPAIAYAAEHGSTGAAAAWARLTGATNWNAIETSGFADMPIWGVVPRSMGSAGPDTPPSPPAAVRIVQP